jgi:hypothetical protein
MSPWWVLVAAVLTAGTAVVARQVARALGHAAPVLDTDHGLAAASAPLVGMAEDAELVQQRLGDVGAVVARRRRLLRMARPGRPWQQLRRHGSPPASP